MLRSSSYKGLALCSKWIIDGVSLPLSLMKAGSCFSHWNTTKARGEPTEEGRCFHSAYEGINRSSDRLIKKTVAGRTRRKGYLSFDRWGRSRKKFLKKKRFLFWLPCTPFSTAKQVENTKMNKWKNISHSVDRGSTTARCSTDVNKVFLSPPLLWSLILYLKIAEHIVEVWYDWV